MGKLISYLKLGRAQTAPLETMPAMVAAILAGGTKTAVFLWGVYGFLYHFAGYSMNSYLDWENGYDKTDPNKQHHPLNQGTLSPEKAKAFTISSFVVTLSYAIALCIYYGSFGAFSVLVMGVIAGIVYNESGKSTMAKPALIGLAHGTVFLVPFMAVKGGGGYVGWLGFFTVFFWVFYQIAISGEIKDMDTDEVNLLKKLGGSYTKTTRPDDPDYPDEALETLHLPQPIPHIGITLRLFFLDLVVITGLVAGMSLPEVALITTMGAITVVLSINLTQSGSYERDKRLRTMSLIEIGSFSTFAMLALPYTPPIVPLLLISISAIYLIVCNKVLWGTYIAPEV